MRAAVFILVVCVAGLLGLGLVMLYSSTMTQNGVHQLLLQMIWCGLGLVACLTATVVDYRRLKQVWWLLLGASVLSLALVLVVGTVHNGARRWFNSHGLSLQPSEFAKIGLLIALAWYGEHFHRQMPTWKRGVILPCLMIGSVVGLIFKEPDLGNALLLAAVSSVVLLLAGIRLRFFLPPMLIILLAVGWFIGHNRMRSERIHSWLHVEETKQDKGLQAYQAMVALGSGGVIGRGLGDSRQKLGYLPEHQTDFIFAIIGEELGLVATLLVMAAFLAIVHCGLFIAWRSTDTFGMLLAAGITFLIGFQACINVGVVTGALPNKGLPLPFISRGGSNLFILLTCVGLLLSIARRASVPESLQPCQENPPDFQDPNPFRLPSANSAPSLTGSL